MSINFKNVTFYYDNAREKKLFDNLNFELENNKKLGIWGKRGSGKTTIIKILAGEIKHYQGKIKVNGTSLEETNSLFDKVSLLLQNPEKQFVFPQIKDEYKFTLDNISQEDAAQNINRIAEYFQFDLENFIKTDRNIFSLSSSELRILQIILTFARNTEYYILDEPFLFLDDDSKLLFQNFLNSINDSALLILSNTEENLKELVGDIIKL